MKQYGSSNADGQFKSENADKAKYMKIKVREEKYENVLALKPEKRLKPKKPSRFIRWLLKTASAAELKKTNFSYTEERTELLAKNEPCVFLMNHSSFIDLKIAATALYPRPFNIVCTSDGFVGKNRFMRSLGCIPTNKFVSDPLLVKDILYSLRKLKSSVLIYPEASYSFDGTATPLPDSVGKLVKMANVPLVMIKTEGAFIHDPLYNGLRPRNTDVSASIKVLWTKEELEKVSVDEIKQKLIEEFSFDNFKSQFERGVSITESFRADGLNRVLYKCASCGAEGKTFGKGITVECSACGKKYTLTESGKLRAEDGETRFEFVSDWYNWERECVKKEILDGVYKLDVKVRICVLKGTKCLYSVGEGRLRHDENGFVLTGLDGKLEYRQSPESSYSLYADYFWYEIGDMICIGEGGIMYYCFPFDCGDVVAKTRLAAEEMYKLKRQGLIK